MAAAAIMTLFPVAIFDITDFPLQISTNMQNVMPISQSAADFEGQRGKQSPTCYASNSEVCSMTKMLCDID